MEFALGQWYPVPVHQRWHIGGMEVIDYSAGRHLLVRVTELNSYWLTTARSCEDAFRLIGPIDDPCSSRIALINTEQSINAVTIFACGGQEPHGGMPVTGLAALSVAARMIDWLAPLQNGFETPAGAKRLLDVHEDASGIAIDFPPVNVEFDRIDVEEVSHE